MGLELQGKLTAGSPRGPLSGLPSGSRAPSVGLGCEHGGQERGCRERARVELGRLHPEDPAPQSGGDRREREIEARAGRPRAPQCFRVVSSGLED